LLLVPCLAPSGRAGSREASAAVGLELAAGGALATMLLGLHAQSLQAVFVPAGRHAQDELAAALALAAGWRPLGALAAGHADPAALPASPPPGSDARQAR
jgi:coenzyme F420-0:L-glutamate ligase/coenzyme F420-1:gamma-L-glutamate ligase